MRSEVELKTDKKINPKVEFEIFKKIDKIILKSTIKELKKLTKTKEIKYTSILLSNLKNSKNEEEAIEIIKLTFFGKNFYKK